MKKRFIHLKMESIAKCRKNLNDYMEILKKADFFLFQDKRILYENLSDSLKLFFCFTITNYENEFRRKGKNSSGPESLSINSVGDKVIDVFLENKLDIITIFAQYIAEERNRKLNIDSFQEYAATILKDNLEKNISAAETKKPVEIFSSLLSYIFYQENDSPGKILEEIINRSVEIEEGLFEGLIIGGYTLSNKLSDKVWKVYKDRKYYAMKFISYGEYFSMDERDFKELSKTIFKPGKAEKLKEFSIQYRNRLYTQSIKKIIAPLIDVVFSIKDKKICEITPFYENTLINTQDHNKSLMMEDLLDFCEKLHTTKNVFLNLCPEKIAFEKEKNEENKTVYKFILIDLKSMKPLFSNNYSIQNTGYESLNCLRKKYWCNVYDDIESIFYIINYMIYGVKEHFENEIESKKDLDFCTYTIKNVILELRELRFLDKIDENPIILNKDRKIESTDYISAENIDDVDFRNADELIFDENEEEIETSLNIDLYIQQLYKNKKVLNPEIYTENSQRCIVKLFYAISESLKDSTRHQLYATKLQEEIYAKFFEQENAETNKNDIEVSLISVQKMFEFIYGVSYNSDK